MIRIRDCKKTLLIRLILYPNYFIGILDFFWIDSFFGRLYESLVYHHTLDLGDTPAVRFQLDSATGIILHNNPSFTTGKVRSSVLYT